MMDARSTNLSRNSLLKTSFISIARPHNLNEFVVIITESSASYRAMANIMYLCR